MSSIWVFAALRWECQVVLRLMAAPARDDVFPGARTGRIGPHDITLLKTGTGPIQAGQLAERAFQACGVSLPSKPDAALVVGLCGGLVPRLREGQVAIYRHVLSAEAGREPVQTSPNLVSALTNGLTSAGIEAAITVGVTVDHFVTDPRERQQLSSRGCDVVDMESHALVSVFTRNGVPSAVIRVVSDDCRRPMPKRSKAFLTEPLRTAGLLRSAFHALQVLRRTLEVTFSMSDL